MAGLFFQNPPPTPNVSLFQQNNQPYQPQPPQNILPQMPVSDLQRMPLYNDLIGAKLGYEATNNALLKLNEELQNPKYNDDQRKVIQDNIALGEKALQGYGNYANFLRNSAGQLGIDVADYGSDRTAQQSAQALNNYAAGRVRDLLALPPVDEQERSHFDELMARGVKASRAHAIINRNHDRVQNNYLRQIFDGMMTYGVNPDNSLNAYGMMLAQKMNPGSPETALSLFANGFATPKEVFNANNQANIWNNRLAQQRALAQAEQEAKWRNLQATLQNQRERDQYLQGQQNQRTAAEIQSREKIEYSKSEQGKIAQWYELYRNEFHLSHEDALAKAIEQVGKPPSKDDKAFEETLNRLGNHYQNIELAMKDGDFDLANQHIDEIANKLRDDNEDYSKILNATEYKKAFESLKIYRKMANREYTFDEGKTELAKAMFRLKYGREPSNDEIMALLKEQGYYGDRTQRKTKIPQQTEISSTPTWTYTPGSHGQLPSYPGNWLPK